MASQIKTKIRQLYSIPCKVIYCNIINNFRQIAGSKVIVNHDICMKFIHSPFIIVSDKKATIVEKEEFIKSMGPIGKKLYNNFESKFASNFVERHELIAVVAKFIWLTTNNSDINNWVNAESIIEDTFTINDKCFSDLTSQIML